MASRSGLFELERAIPSECADRLRDGRADIGIVPSVELNRQKLEIIPGCGIACRAEVRSILLISKVAFGQIRTLATDSSSRTSVALSRVVLARKYGVEPRLTSLAPHLGTMLELCDAALIIGDAALVLNPAELPFRVLDLGSEWTQMTGLPMVFAVWAARAGFPTQDPAPFAASLRFGLEHVDDIARDEHAKLGISEALAREYLTRNIVFELGEQRIRGAESFSTICFGAGEPGGNQKGYGMMTRQEAIDLFRSDDLIGIGMAADAVRRKLHPHGIVSYIIDRNINYTNFCTEYCSFCAFYRPMGHAEGYLHPKEVIFDKIQETIDLGGTGILMQGGLHPELKIEWYEDLLRSIKQRFGDRIWNHCFSAPEIVNIAEVSGLTLHDTIARLRDAGLESIPGGGAEILDNDVRRRIARLKSSAQDWIDVHRAAHALGLRTTATMMFGCGETIEQRMNHFDIVRQIQEDTGGFTAFIPWSFQRENTSLGRFVKEEATAVEYLKTLAISRLYLDNILNIQSSWVTPGLKTCQVGLRFGGNDVGSIMIEENVVSAAGAHHRASEEQLRRLIRDAGFIPKQRDTLYRTYFLN